MRAAGLEQTDVIDDDQALWSRQRGGQRSQSRALVRVAAAPSALGAVIAVAQACDATLVGRAALGCELSRARPRRAWSGCAAACPRRPRPSCSTRPQMRARGWPLGGRADPGAVELMRRVKERFDPGGSLQPRRFRGGHLGIDAGL